MWGTSRSVLCNVCVNILNKKVKDNYPTDNQLNRNHNFLNGGNLVAQGGGTGVCHRVVPQGRATGVCHKVVPHGGGTGQFIVEINSITSASERLKWNFGGIFFS
jgi:hypothetical protein